MKKKVEAKKSVGKSTMTPPVKKGEKALAAKKAKVKKL